MRTDRDNVECVVLAKLALIMEQDASTIGREEHQNLYAVVATENQDVLNVVSVRVASNPKVVVAVASTLDTSSVQNMDIA